MSDKQVKRVFLVDDHPLLRRGMAQMIMQEKDLSVCGEAEDAATAIQLIEQDPPDVALVDISLKDSSGIDLIKDIRVRAPKVLILVLSMHDETFYAERVLRAGARGYVTKGESATRVIEGIRQLLAGKVFVSDLVSSKMISRLVKGMGAEAGDVDILSDREFEVLEMIGKGTQTREIAETLHLSVKTIDAHRENIKRKLGLSDASELLKYAIRWAQSQQK